MIHDSLDAVQRWWHGLGYELCYTLWLCGGAVVLVLMLLLSYYCLRRLAGHRKFRGTWYTHSQFEELLRMLREDHLAGHRVMRHEELKLLRHEMLGADFKPLFRDKYGGYS